MDRKRICACKPEIHRASFQLRTCRDAPVPKQSLRVEAGVDGHKTLEPRMAVGSLYIKEILL